MLNDITTIIYTLKIISISIMTFYTNTKIMNLKFNNKVMISLSLIINASICSMIKYLSNSMLSIICVIFLLALVFAKFSNNKLGYSVLINFISISINYIFFIIAIIVSYIPYKIINIENDYINLLLIVLIYSLMIILFFKIKRFKKGFNFIKKASENDILEIITMSISVTVVFSFTMLSNTNKEITKDIFISFVVFSIIMFITIQKSLELYYKQKLQKRELEETREELKKVKEERNELQKENLKISKEKHSIVYNQEKLEYKINQLLLKNETAEELQIKDKIEEISNKIRNEDVTIELTKTGIEEIDDMLKYMQAKCKKNNINFELQVKGNIHHMINKFIEKKDLEILLADHIKNAIIAINYSKNINKSILVKLGIIDGVYSVYFYDTGTEFNKETLLNLGKKPSTTHADNGGTGMGFLNTFDKLKKYKASITINEYGKPCEDNYTKYIAIKFDNKNEYQIHSYRFAEMKSKICRNGDVSK